MSYVADPFNGQVRLAAGNANVPTNAPIRPFQVWVDKVGQLISGTFTSGGINLSGQGITSLTIGTNTMSSDNPFACWLVQSFSTSAGYLSFDISGNNITNTAIIDQILTDLHTLFTNNGIVGLFNLSGGTMAAPTVNGIGVFSAGTTSVNGGYIQNGALNNGKHYYNLIGTSGDITSSCVVWTGASWDIKDAGGLTQYASTDDTVTPNIATFTSSAGSDPAPTISLSNAAKAALVVAGSTVTTN